MTAERHPNHRSQASLPPELRRTTVPTHVRAWIGRRLGSDIDRVRRLPGASSTAVHLLALADGRRVVLRRYLWSGYLEAEPDAPYRELDALEFATAAGLPAPETLAADPSGHEVGDGVPLVVMTRRPGRAVAVPDVARLAEVAAKIHATDPAGFAHDYFPWYATTTTGPPPSARRPALWDAALTVWHTEMPDHDVRFIHRDFHPGNVLWRRGACSGVVDWASACRGPVGCDVAHCRENLVHLGGDTVADAFQAHYERITGTTHHPYWEIASTLEHGPSGWTHQAIAHAERRLTRALGLIDRLP